jgi:hypothetical protein
MCGSNRIGPVRGRTVYHMTAEGRHALHYLIDLMELRWRWVARSLTALEAVESTGDKPANRELDSGITTRPFPDWRG